MTPKTRGVHHIGLTVSDLEASSHFFVSILGWKEVRRDERYPAVFVSDGHIMLTLWKNRETPVCTFNRRRNIGLHHLALLVEQAPELERIHQHLVEHGIDIEFPPEPLRGGPAMHMMCLDPSGIRIEFIWPGNQAR